MRKPHPNARKLRNDMPEAERRLWSRLRLKQLGGFRFRRQHTIGPFIADFACVEAMLVVELDGAQHGREDAPARDAARDKFIEEKGYLVLRFWNEAVVRRMDDVLNEIHGVACERATARSLGLISKK
jgi:very-short-patch-repair endonuclease